MEEIALLITCFFVTTLIGRAVLSILTGGKRLGMTFFERIGLSCLFGFGAITLEMFILGLLGVYFTRLNILLPWVLPGIGFVLFRRKETYLPLERPVTARARASGFEITLMALIAVQTAYNFFRALMRPIEAYDAVAIYGLKSKIIYLDGKITAEFFKNLASNFQGCHPDYPLFIPLAQDWVYVFLGSFNDILVKAVSPIFYVSFIFIFYSVLKRITKNRSLAFLFTFFLATIKQFSDYSTIGVTDMELGIFFGLSLFYLYLWMAEGRASYLNISLFSSILAVWTKNEGTLLGLFTVFIIFVYAMKNFKKIKKSALAHLFVYAILVFLFLLSWTAFKNSLGLVNENFNPSMINAANILSGFKKLPVIAYEFQKQLFGFKKWNIFWVMFLLVLLGKFRSALSGDIKYITLVFFLFALGYAFIYIVSVVEIDFFVRATGSRFLLHILPVSVFWTALMAHKENLQNLSR